MHYVCIQSLTLTTICILHYHMHWNFKDFLSCTLTCVCAKELEGFDIARAILKNREGGMEY